MYEEAETVADTLITCIERGYCVLDDEIQGILNKHLGAIVDVLYAKYPQEKYPGNNGKFVRAKFMALTLNDILTAKDKSEFDGYKNNFKEKFEVLLELYALKEANEDYKEALARVRDTFSGRWIGMAGNSMLYYRDLILAAENDPSRANELPKLRENMEKSMSLRAEAEEFIRQQPKLKN